MRRFTSLLLILCSGLLMTLSSPAAAQVFRPYKVTISDTAAAASAGGYYFLAPLKPKTGSGINSTHFILDGLGRIVYAKEFRGGISVNDFALQPDGRMSYKSPRPFYFMDSSFRITDSVSVKNGLMLDGHDLQVLPNGHYLALGFENVQMDLSAYHMFNNNGSPGSATANVRCGVVQELDAQKNVVFEWHAKDHLAFDEVDEHYLSNPSDVDWTHLNAVAPDADGNIMLSVRHFNMIVKINRQDGSIIWRLGGKLNQFSFTNDPYEFIAQHDVRRIKNGNITVFDNGRADVTPFHPAGGKEYSLDETNHIATLVWRHVEDSTAYSDALGNVQRLDNGNTLVNYGMFVHKDIVFNVISPSGGKVFEIRFADSLVSYRAFWYPSLPWHLKRPQLNCYTQNGKHFLQADSGYAHYYWSTGDTGRVIEVTKADTFSVLVPAGNGGFISSEYLAVNNPTDPCGLSGIRENAAADVSFSVYPNPASDQLFVNTSQPFQKTRYISLFDFSGKEVYASEIPAGNERTILNISALPKGIYMLRMGDFSRKIIKL
jgi:hypothetical protein